MRISLIAIFSLISSLSYCQNFAGKWGINYILGEEYKEEYLLTTANKKKPYGKYLNLKEDGTFVSDETAPCGNHRFYRTIGVYELIENNRVRFVLKQYMVDGIGYAHKDEEVDEDLGVFSIDKGVDSIKLTKIK